MKAGAGAGWLQGLGRGSGPPVGSGGGAVGLEHPVPKHRGGQWDHPQLGVGNPPPCCPPSIQPYKTSPAVPPACFSTGPRGWRPGRRPKAPGTSEAEACAGRPRPCGGVGPALGRGACRQRGPERVRVPRARSLSLPPSLPAAWQPATAPGVRSFLTTSQVPELIWELFISCQKTALPAKKTTLAAARPRAWYEGSLPA